MTLRRSLRLAVAPLAVACLVTTMAGCKADDTGTAAGTEAATKTTRPAEAGSLPGSPAGDQASGGQDVAPAVNGKNPRCQASQLRVAVKPGGGVSGHLGLIITFTNTGTKTCTMYGYPGVSFLTAETGQQLGQAAARTTTATPSTITLTKGQTAQATLIWPNPDPYPTDTCRPATAAGLRIYPPDDTNALFAPTQQQVCTTTQVSPPEISPVESGRVS